MQGQNDDQLKWPYKGIVTVTLLNQLEDNQHITNSLYLGMMSMHTLLRSLNLIQSEMIVDGDVQSLFHYQKLRVLLLIHSI